MVERNRSRRALEPRLGRARRPVEDRHRRGLDASGFEAAGLCAGSAGEGGECKGDASAARSAPRARGQVERWSCSALFARVLDRGSVGCCVEQTADGAVAQGSTGRGARPVTGQSRRSPTHHPGRTRVQRLPGRTSLIEAVTLARRSRTASSPWARAQERGTCTAFRERPVLRHASRRPTRPAWRAPRPVARTSRPFRRTPPRPGQHRELPSSDRARAVPSASCRLFPRGSPW